MRKTLIKIRTALAFFLVFLMLIPNVSHAEQTNTSDLINGGFETGDLSGWTKGTVVDSVSIISSDSFVFPYSGNYMLRLGTATSSNSINQNIGNNEVYQDFIANNSTLTFYYNAYTYDYTGYDEFSYKLIDIDTNQVIHSFTQGGWGIGGDTTLKTTGWQSVNLDISNYVGKNLRLYFNCAGTKDTLYASWAYVDFGDQNSANGSIIVNSQSNNTQEGSQGIVYEVSLSKQPQSNVEVNIQGDSQVTVNSAQLVFTPDNWNIKQSILVTAIDDSVFEGNHFGKITFNAASLDSNFNNIPTTNTIYISDNDSDTSGYYTISAQISSGQGQVSPQVQTVKQGDNISIQITPDAGFVAFVLDNGVNVSEKVVQNVYAINNVSEHHNIAVNFIPKTPPKVLYTNPLNGASNVYIDANIIIKFSEEVQAGDNFNNIEVLDENSVVVPVEKILNGDTLILNPTSYLGDNKQYTVNIPASAVKNSTGSALVDTYKFTFKAQGTSVLVLNSINIYPTTITLGAGQQQQLKVMGNMSDGSTKDVTLGSEGTIYTTSSSSVATVDANGLITVSPTAGAGFQATVTATNSGKSTSCIVTVADAANTVTNLSIDPLAISKGKGEQQQLQVVATMGDGSTKDVTLGSEGTIYTTSSSSVATIDANGLITVLPTAGVGYKTTITAKYGGKTATSVVTVSN